MCFWLFIHRQQRWLSPVPFQVTTNETYAMSYLMKALMEQHHPAPRATKCNEMAVMSSQKVTHQLCGYLMLFGYLHYNNYMYVMMIYDGNE